MAANIDSMAYYGKVPWHRHGRKLSNPATAEEAIRAAGLDWDVQLQPLYTGPGRNIRVKDRFVVCRTDRLGEADGGQLGVVGKQFEPLQNRSAFAFLDPVVDRDACIYHTAGSLRGGRHVWMLAKLPGYIRVTGDDITEKYLLLANGHDGTMAVRVLFTPIRVVCQNTLALALREGQGLSIRHYPDVNQRLAQASQLMGIANRVYEKAGVIMQRSAKVCMLGYRLDGFINRVLPLGEDEKERTKTIATHQRIRELFETGDGNSLPGVRGTLWAAYNAVTQWVDRESYTKRTKEPLRSIWFGQGAATKQRAFEVMRAGSA